MLQIPFHRSSPYPPALEISQGIHPPQLTCPVKQHGCVPPERGAALGGGYTSAAGPCARRAALGQAGLTVWVSDMGATTFYCFLLMPC